MTTLLTGDIHMTTSPREVYRFGLFSWLAEQARSYQADQVIILGDLTERFDRHPAQLVTRMVMGVSEIAEVCPVYVLRGNHDAVDPNWPFFSFLSGIPNVTFISEPLVYNLRISDQEMPVVFLPSSRDPQVDWRGVDFASVARIFMHQTVIGAAYDNGMPADKGLPLSFFADFPGEIYSGDIHSPQVVGKRPSVTYVGAPYHIRFGDIFEPRCLLLTTDGYRDLHFPAPRKITIDLTAEDLVR